MFDIHTTVLMARLLTSYGLSPAIDWSSSLAEQNAMILFRQEHLVVDYSLLTVAATRRLEKSLRL